MGEGHVRCTLVGSERGRVEAIAFRAGQTALGPALLDPARPILHVAGALRIDRYNGRETVRLQIDDAARPRRGRCLLDFIGSSRYMLPLFRPRPHRLEA